MTDAEGPVFLSAPPERIELPAGRSVIRCRSSRAAEVALAINESLDHLRPWMAWAAEPVTEDGMATFFAEKEQLWDERRDFAVHIVEGPEDRVVGGAGLHGRIGRHGLEIGYWVHVDRIGQGIATEVARALTSAAVAIEGIERVRIQCDDANVRSARVPEKLGYALLGVRIPDEGPCAGRPAQDWEVTRADWMARAAGGSP